MFHRLLVALVPAFALLVAPAPAQAAACSGTSGVTVVVQFPSGPVVRCAPGNPSSGYEALTSAGFSLTYAQGSGAGALCRIDGQPGNVNCGAMPPANNYWSYWHAKPGGSWSYSSIGGGGYDPAPGSVEGWVLGDGGSAPSIRPPGGSTPTPTPKPTPKPTPRPTAKPTRVPVIPPTTAPTTPGSTSTTATPGTTPTGTPSGSATTSTTATAGSSPTTSASTATATAAAGSSVSASAGASEKTGGGGLSWIWGVAMVAILGVAAGVTAAVRRRS